MAEDVYAHFEGLVGECSDKDHLGDNGWTQISSFSFGFGFQKKSPLPVGKGGTSGKKTLEQINKKVEAQDAKMAAMAADKAGGKSDKDWGHSGALDFEKVTFSKKADSMSKRLVELCHEGESLSKVIIVMCRPGGTNKDEKIEFLRLIFEEVYLKTCVLNLATEGLPAEDLSFEYDTVRLESVWTDNAIGNRRPDQPIGAGWNLADQKPA